MKNKISVFEIKKAKKIDFLTGSALGLTTLFVACGAMLSLTSQTKALVEVTSSARATVRVTPACSMSGVVLTPHIENEASTGSYIPDIGTTKITTHCNDGNGFAIYAVGFSNDTYGNTNMIGSTSGATFNTGTATGNVSNWAMQVTKDTTSYNPNNLSIVSNYDTYKAVPSSYDKVASYSTATDVGESEPVGSSIFTTYAVRLSSSQTPDTYVGKVKYTLVHPNDAEVPTNNLVFKAGSGINTVIVAPENEGYKPYYATSGNPVTFASFTAGDKYLITVVPTAGYMLDAWNRNTHAGTLGSATLLTTTYTVGAAGETLTAVGTSGAYTSMNTLTLANCPTTGVNVTDTRNNKSYTVAKFGSYCYMLSNLRLDGGATLTSSDSDIYANGVSFPDPSEPSEIIIVTSFTTPTDSWTSSSQDYYCKAMMKVINNEYYYNWFAAKANPYECLNPTDVSSVTSDMDSYGLGSICPAGWTLPAYVGDVTSSALWDNGANPGALMTSGLFASGSQVDLGYSGFWWSNGITLSYYEAPHLVLDSSAYGTVGDIYKGFSVRCMRSS